MDVPLRNIWHYANSWIRETTTWACHEQLNCLIRDIKHRILQFSDSPILEFKVLQKAFKVKKQGLNYFLK